MINLAPYKKEDFYLEEFFLIWKGLFWTRPVSMLCIHERGENVWQ